MAYHPPTPELDIDAICDMLTAGSSYQEIADHLGVSRSTVYRFCTNENNSARTREAREQSAEEFAEEAELVLRKALEPVEVENEEGETKMVFQTQASVTAANNLASHLRWKAKMRNRNEYGDQIDVTHDVGGNLANMLHDARQRVRAERARREMIAVEPGQIPGGIVRVEE